MKQSLRDAWVEALRSGQYAQGKHELKAVDDGGFVSHCCLGVLCEVAGKNIPGSAETLDNDLELREVRDAMGLGAFYREDGGRTLQRQLANMNDDDEKSFPQIADWIEQNIPEQP